MIPSRKHPQRRQIPERELNTQERFWIREILSRNELWSDFDPGPTKVIGECDCGECRTAYLESSQNQSVKGTRGYIGRIEIRTNNEFGITVTLDHLDGKLSELYVNAVDLSDEGSRTFPKQWEEITYIVEPM